MTFTDIITHPSKLFHSFSMSDDLNKKDKHEKCQQTNLSILNLFPRHRQRKNSNEQGQQQQQNSLLHPPSILTTSELSRSISNKSITFASIFDESENENINKDNNVVFDLGTSGENEDLVIIVPNKYVNNEPILNNSEPYPFRTEIPSCSLPKSNLSTNTINTNHSGKKLLHHLIHYHRPKKLRHPIKTIQTINKIQRSKSAPNMLFSLSSPSTTTTTTTTEIITINNHQPSLKTIRRWFKSSKFSRFLQLFIKHSNENTNTKHIKQKSCRKLATSKKNSDLFY